MTYILDLGEPLQLFAVENSIQYPIAHTEITILSIMDNTEEKLLSRLWSSDRCLMHLFGIQSSYMLLNGLEEHTSAIIYVQSILLSFKG